VKRGFLKKIFIFYKINVQSKQLNPKTRMQNFDTPTGMNLDLYSTVPDQLLKVLF
jgi:hypothetical protein